MLKQVMVHGQRFELKSTDGSLWCSSPADLVNIKRRREAISEEIKKSAQSIYVKRVDDSTGYDAEDYHELVMGLRHWRLY